MTRLRIDISRVADAVLRGMVTPQETDEILRGLGAAAYAHWVKLAQEKLNTSSRDYALGLQLVQFPKHVEVVLTGRVPNMIENGWDGGDMRKWLLASPKAHTAKDGSKYLAIPFRHGTPGTSGRNVGAVMPPEIARAAKRLAPTTTHVQETSQGRISSTAWGGRLNPTNKFLRQDTRATLNRLKQPWHTTSIYTGMIRRVTTYPSGAKSAAYQTFRTISTHSNDPRS